MANKTPYLGLILPANSEYTDSWDIPMNQNFSTIDSAMESVTDEVHAARFTKPTLSAFLSVSINDDGTLKSTEEVTDAQNSKVYGSNANGEDYTLKQRLDLGDTEVFTARNGLTSLQSILSFCNNDSNYPDTVLSGAATTTGAPNFMTVSANEFSLNGSSETIVFNIAGRRMEVNDDIVTTASGADGTKQLVAFVPTSPWVVRTATGASTLEDTSNGSRVQIFEDPAADFTALRVRPGMILTITTSTSDNAGSYIVSTVAVGGDVRKLTIIGVFASLATTSLAYTITDPLRPGFSAVDPAAPTPGLCVVGEATYNTGTLTNGLTYYFKRKYISAYTGINVSATPIVELVFDHNLGRLPKNIQVFVSQAPDGSQPMEPLSTCQVGNTLAVDITNNLAWSPGVWTPAAAPTTATPDYNPLPDMVIGPIIGTLTGTVYSRNSVRVQSTTTQIFIKNITNNRLYTSYNGTDYTSGFIQVIVE